MLTSSGIKTYLVGAEVIASYLENGQSGDVLEITSVVEGTEFINVPEGIEIKNTTDVDILINSQELKAGDSMKVSSLQNPSESTDQPSDKPQQEMSADENIPETGDDTNRTLMFVIMGLAAIAAAGTVVYGRRKRSN